MNPDWKYKITLDNPEWYEMKQWCSAHIGEFGEGWYKLGVDPTDYLINGISGISRTTWYFKTEKDASLFALRWT